MAALPLWGSCHLESPKKKRVNAPLRMVKNFTRASQSLDSESLKRPKAAEGFSWNSRIAEGTVTHAHKLHLLILATNDRALWGEESDPERIAEDIQPLPK